MARHIGTNIVGLVMSKTFFTPTFPYDLKVAREHSHGSCVADKAEDKRLLIMYLQISVFPNDSRVVLTYVHTIGKEPRSVRNCIVSYIIIAV